MPMSPATALLHAKVARLRRSTSTRISRRTAASSRAADRAITLAKDNLNDALRSQDLVLIQEAEERLTMVAAAIDRARWSRDDWHRYFGNKGRLWLR